MTLDSPTPDLRRIGESALAETLNVFLSLPATTLNPSDRRALPVGGSEIIGTIPITGSRISGEVQVQFPRAFLEQAVHRLMGCDGETRLADELLEDAARELANMAAGRVAEHFRAGGFPCSLGAPCVSFSERLPMEPETKVDHGRTILLCNGHLLSVEIRCRYSVT